MAPKALKSYRVILHSASKSSGTLSDAVFAIDIPDILDPSSEYQVAVESFHAEDRTFFPDTAYQIVCPTLPQGNTYSTLVKGSGMVLLTHSGPDYTRDVSFDCVGCKLTDPNFLRSQQLLISFRHLNGASMDPGTDWVTTLVVYPIPRAPQEKGTC